MLVMISLSSGGICACWISLFRFSSVMPEGTNHGHHTHTAPTHAHTQRRRQSWGGAGRAPLLPSGLVGVNLFAAPAFPSDEDKIGTPTQPTPGTPPRAVTTCATPHSLRFPLFPVCFSATLAHAHVGTDKSLCAHLLQRTLWAMTTGVKLLLEGTDSKCGVSHKCQADALQ